MKLAKFREGGRDGCLAVVSRDLRHAVRATGIAPTLLHALEAWEYFAPRLNQLSQSLNAGAAPPARP
jgi:fumarylacetoacetate (FAA) hydrolase